MSVGASDFYNCFEISYGGVKSTMVRYCFVILHYQGIEDTIRCIESIKKQNGYEKCRIVVIDNDSPNGSGELLKDKYNGDKGVDVILNPFNSGFSWANNKAGEYAYKEYHPDFYIVINNDIIIDDKFFLNKIEDEYKKYNFEVLGPDVYNPIQKVHQSPLRKKAPGLIEITKTIVFNKLLKRMINNKILDRFVCRYFRELEEKKSDTNQYEKRQCSVCLMGAALIFSSEFYERRKVFFEPETDFYYEEYILDYYCKKQNLKVVYSPELMVKHFSGAATKKTYSEYKEKCKFIIENTIKGASIYRSYIMGNGDGKYEY